MPDPSTSPPSWQTIQSDPDFQAMAPDQQTALRYRYLHRVVMPDPAYQQMPMDQKKGVVGRLLNIDATPGAQQETNPIQAFTRAEISEEASNTPTGNVIRAGQRATGQVPDADPGAKLGLGGNFYTADPVNDAANYAGRLVAQLTDPVNALPLGMGGHAAPVVGDGVAAIARAVAPAVTKGAAVNAGIGGTASAAGQFADTGHIDPLQTLGDAGSSAVFGGLMAGAHPVASALSRETPSARLPGLNLLPTDRADGYTVPPHVADWLQAGDEAQAARQQQQAESAARWAADQARWKEQDEAASRAAAAQAQATAQQAATDNHASLTGYTPRNPQAADAQWGAVNTPETLPQGPGVYPEPLAGPRQLGDVKLPPVAQPALETLAPTPAPVQSVIDPYTNRPTAAVPNESMTARPAEQAGQASSEAAPAIEPPPAVESKPDPAPNAGIDAARAHMNFERLDLDPAEKERMARLVNEYVAENGDAHKTPVTFDQIRQEAGGIAPAALDQLATPRLGETMDPAVRYAARIRLNETMDAIRSLETQMQNGALSHEVMKGLREEHGNLNDRAKKLLDVLLPTRSQDGRNLAFHNMMAGKSFDSEYWTARARRVGGRTDPAFERRTNGILGNGRTAEARVKAAEAALAEKGIDPKNPTASPEVQPATARADAPASSLASVADALESNGQATLEKARKNTTLGTAGGAGGDLLLGHAQVLAARMLRGAVRFEDWAREMVAAHGEAITQHLPAIWSRAKELTARATGEQSGASRNPFQSWRKFGDPSAGARALTHPDPAIQSLLDEHHQATQQVNAARISLAQHFATLDRHGLLQTLSMLRKAGLLTSVRTLTKITVSHVTLQALEEAARLPSWGVDLVASAITGGPRTKLSPSAARVWVATQDAFTKGLAESWEILRHGMSDAELAKLNIPGELNSSIPMVGPVLSAYVNGVMRVHGAAYHPFKVFAATKSMHEQARLTAMAEMNLRVGGGPMLDSATRARLDARVTHLLQNPTPQMEAEAVSAAEHATFTEENRLAQGISSLKQRQGPMGRFLIDQVLPFTHVPANVCVRVLDYAGIGGAVRIAGIGVGRLRGEVVGALTPGEQKTIADAFGRGLVGTGAIMYGYWLAQKGLATGTYDPKYKDLYQAAGRGFSSIKVGGKWVPIGDLSPMGNLIALGATLHRDKGGAASIATAGAATVLDQPMMQGVTQMESLHKDPVKGATKFAADNLASYVPTMISDIANSRDPKAREVSHEGLSALAEAVKAKIPGQRETLPAKIGVFGDEVPNVRGGMGAFNTFAGPTDRTATNPAAAELIRLEAARQEGEPSIPLTQAGKSYTLAGQKFALPPALLHDRRVATGQAVGSMLNDFATDPGYRALTGDDEAQRSMLMKALAAGHEQGGAMFRAKNADALWALMQAAQNQARGGSALQQAISRGGR